VTPVRLTLLWDRVRSSYWFIPTLMLLGGAVLAVALITLDRWRDSDDLSGPWWIFSGGAEGARTVLSTVAGSVVTVAGVTFSITIAVLSLTSSQFGPRLLRGFLRDTGTQMVLGTFLGTFLYCLLVLRTVRSVEEVYFVPHIAVTGGVALALASVCMLVYFIHHVTRSVQVDGIVGRTARDFLRAIDRLFPEEIGLASGAAPPHAEREQAETAEAALRERGMPVLARRSGYVQAVDGGALLTLATERRLRLWIDHRPGRFVTRGAPLAHVVVEPDVPGQGREEEEPDWENRLYDAFSLGEERTATQDVEFIVQQLVEVAVRALSPGINDPHTAILCLDHLSAGLCVLAGRQMPSAFRHDDHGILRIVAAPVTFAGVLEAAFDGIRHYGRADIRVMVRLLEVIGTVAVCARNEAQRDALREQAVRTRQAALESLSPGAPPDAIEAAYREVVRSANRAGAEL
jgi:uncharacterized membrane protein